MSESGGCERDRRRESKCRDNHFPQYDFVRQIAGDNVEVSMLLKPGEETHSYEPTPQDILKIQNCDLFIYVGGENDEWVEDILDSIDTEHIRLLRLIDCVDTVNEEHVEGMKEERGHEHEEEEEHEHEHGEEEHETHETLTPDEHVWTSPENAIAIVEQIADVLGELDPEQTAVYEENEKAYVSLLEELDDEFREVVSSAKRDVLLLETVFRSGILQMNTVWNTMRHSRAAHPIRSQVRQQWHF